VVDRILRVPDEHRTFTVPASEALRRFGVDRALLTELIDQGLPCRAAGPELTLDPADLSNVSLGLSLASPQTVIMKRWKKSLVEQLRHGSGHFELRLSWRCPLPRHAGACEFRVAPEVAGAELGASADTSMTILAEPLAEDHDFGPDFDDLVAEARALYFHLVPDGLATDIGFARRSRLADCRLASEYLAEVAADRGLTTRTASGYFVGAPFPTPHAWLEVAVGDRWLPADPFYLNTLRRWGILPAEDGRLRRSPRNLFWRLRDSADIDAPLVRHHRQGSAEGVTAPVVVAAQWRPYPIPRPRQPGAIDG
jgi:hypothetical protein